MFGISLFTIFFLHFPLSFAKSCASQPPNKNLKVMFSDNSGNNKDTAKLLFMTTCLSNLEDCSKGIPLKEIIKENTTNLGNIEKYITKTICEGNTETITCPIGCAIRIHDGFYGRRDRLTCPDKRISNTNCKANDSLTKLKRLCNNYKTCSIESSNSKYGDPCNGTFKYVSVTYSCQIDDKTKKCFAWKGSNRTYCLTLQEMNCQYAKENCQIQKGTLVTLGAKSCVNRTPIGSHLSFLLQQLNMTSVKKIWVMKVEGGLTEKENCIFMDTKTFQLNEFKDIESERNYFGLCQIEGSAC